MLGASCIPSLGLALAGEKGDILQTLSSRFQTPRMVTAITVSPS